MTSTRRRFFLSSLGLTGAGAAGCLASPDQPEEHDHHVRTDEGGEPSVVYRLSPVGVIENPKNAEVARIRIQPRFADGLLGLEEWSHVHVFWWFDKNDVPVKRRILQVHPRGDRKNPRTGVFACRAPVRPNLLAHTVCRIVSVESPVLTVDGIDAFDGTPVLDLKPLTPKDVPRDKVRVPGWAEKGKKKES